MKYYGSVGEIPKEAYRRLDQVLYKAECGLCKKQIEKGSPAYWAKRAIRVNGKVKSAMAHEECWNEMRSGPAETKPTPTNKPASHDEENGPGVVPGEETSAETSPGTSQEGEGAPDSSGPQTLEDILAQKVAPIVKEGLEDELAARVNAVVQEMAPTRVVHEFKHLDFSLGEEEEDEIVHPQTPKLVAALKAGLNVLLWGPPGTGKTHAATNILKRMDLSYYIQGPVYDSFELRGFKDATGAFQPTQFTCWAREAGSVIIFDEVDGSNPQALLPANLALENHILETPDGPEEISRDNLAIATANTNLQGATSDFTARQRLDRAFTSRFKAKIHWPIDERMETAIALKHHFGTKARVRWSQALRKKISDRGIDVEWSPRSTFAYCRLRAVGLDHGDAVEISNLNVIDDVETFTHLKESVEAPE